VALGAALAVGDAHPIAVAAVADVVATLVIFAGSVWLANSSLYDPYWSVAPVPIAFYWALGPGSEAGASGLRQVCALVLVVAWGARLTGNWLRGWTGFGHEDWRYVDLRASSGRTWPLANFSGIHSFPPVVVFLGLLPLYPALAAGARPFGLLDLLAILVTGGGIALETIADEQLRAFVRAGRARGATLQTGLWARVRHPNYLGENLFWWGLWLFGLAADPGWWWTGVGALAITVMFLTASIPMIDRRMLERRLDYADYKTRVPALLPRLRRG
jgi:steroid 5-alpha reductase family enzyme